jgi:hypothetical protein
MAGAGYKLFQTGDVLTAAQVNTYLNEQTVMVFANAAARTSALTSVLAEGMVSYLQDTNAVEVYNGSAWVGVSGAGDITEVQAGVGISVASGTGPIPVITNSSTDLITTAGDILYGTAADTVARLGIGTAGQVLKVNSGATAPEWGAAAAGALTKITSGSFSGASSFSVDSAFSATYANYKMFVVGTDGGGTAASIQIRFRTSGSDVTTASYSGGRNSTIWSSGTTEIDTTNADSKITFGRVDTSGGWWLAFDLISPFASQATAAIGGHADNTRGGASAGRFSGSNSFDGIKVLNASPNNIAGSYYIYGYGN